MLLKNLKMSKKSKVAFEPTASYSKIQNRLGPTGTYLSWLVFISFTVIIVQNLTSILNFTTKTINVAITTLPVNNINLQPQEANLFQKNVDEDDWRRINENIFVYSAFIDTRYNESFVRIIGGVRILDVKFSDVKCLLKYNFSTIMEAAGSYEILMEHHKEPSRAAFFYCYFASKQLPEYAAIVPANYTGTENVPWMSVHSLKNSSTYSTIGVCIRPMYNYTDIFGIAEFIAYYEALGVTHFTFYTYTGVTKVIQFLWDLKTNNYSIDILPWTLPEELESFHAEGQVASVNDCIYRQMRNLTYSVVVDLDEFITPRHGIGLKGKLKAFEVPGKKHGSFVFRSSLFCSEFSQDDLPEIISPFRTQKGIRRQKFIYPFKKRAKYIAKTSTIDMAGIHYVWRHVPGWEKHLVPANEVLVHHYRFGLCSEINETVEMDVEIDVESRKYLNQLMRSRSVEVWKFKYS